MFPVQLHFKEMKQGGFKLTYHFGLRVFFTILSLFLTSMIITSDGMPLPAGLMLLISFGGAVYKEEWILKKEAVTYKIGLLFFYSTKIWKRDEITETGFSHFTKGSRKQVEDSKRTMFQKQMCQFYIRTEVSKEVIDVMSESRKKKVEKIAEKIAALYGLPLTRS